jgi:hypothetical protein
MTISSSARIGYNIIFRGIPLYNTFYLQIHYMSYMTDDHITCALKPAKIAIGHAAKRPWHVEPQGGVGVKLILNFF